MDEILEEDWSDYENDYVVYTDGLDKDGQPS